jgi:hypothetical protein
MVDSPARCDSSQRGVAPSGWSRGLWRGSRTPSSLPVRAPASMAMHSFSAPLHLFIAPLLLRPLRRHAHALQATRLIQPPRERELRDAYLSGSTLRTPELGSEDVRCSMSLTPHEPGRIGSALADTIPHTSFSPSHGTSLNRPGPRQVAASIPLRKFRPPPALAIPSGGLR